MIFNYMYFNALKVPFWTTFEFNTLKDFRKKEWNKSNVFVNL